MPALFLSVVPLFVLLAGVAAAQPSTPPVTADDARHTVVLGVMGQRAVPELRISPGVLTALLFGSPLKLAGVELEEQGLLARMTVLDDALLLVPSNSLNAGRILRLKVRFVDGVVPASADFLLVVDPLQAEHQVNVELQQPMADACKQAVEEERAKTQECRAELEWMRKRPDGLTGLIANGQLADKGVTARRALREKDFTQRPGEPILITETMSYRARGLVAVELKAKNYSSRPWAAAGAQLVGEGGVRLKVLRVWPLEPIPPGSERRRVVVEAEAAETEARGRFALLLWQDGEPPSVSVEGVTFP
ncbi:DUF2381 family protein [Archangium violaceum]|uniref:DUF2381 family protein n=1 Tax=Archangium violaceum TaxID=83451 RepID=UPI00193B6906|nr:DUF2381 family protein [Archangium violaceum]QRK04778.1 DUF2381 family protein [Archangium violaceum]